MTQLPPFTPNDPAGYRRRLEEEFDIGDGANQMMTWLIFLLVLGATFGLGIAAGFIVARTMLP